MIINFKVMNNNKIEKMTCERAREFSLYNLLSSIGYSPTKENEKEAWFLSPLREEKSASFKISKKLNRWYDHGLGLGGNTLDFVINYKKCNVTEALEFLSGNSISFSFHKAEPNNNITPILENKIVIKKVKELKNSALLSYAKNRRIEPEILKQFCSEIHYEFKGKLYFSIGLKNISDGWELRNKYLKCSSSPKNYSHFNNGKDNLKIVEGLFDFLSLISLFPETLNDSDFIVLNSLAFKSRVVKLFPNYKSIDLYLDSGKGGREATVSLIAGEIKCQDFSSIYKDFDDLNAFHQGSF